MIIINTEFLKNSINPVNLIKCIKYAIDFNRTHPDYFHPCGLLVFCGSQGSGKTLSATQYIIKLSYHYPKAIICSNVDINGINPESVIIEYNGLDCLKNVENGEYGVIYFIDEIHLEMNSLESKNIDIDIMTEISQQRKQRKHIIGTSQIYGRMAKPLREQIKNAVLCRNFFRFIQFNKLIDGDKTEEKDGKLHTDSVKRFIWFHNPDMYLKYDTYAKMKRYRNEWNGRKRIVYDT